MTNIDRAQKIISATPTRVSPGVRVASAVLIGVGVVGVWLGCNGSGLHPALWVAILVSTSLIVGLAVVGVLISAIFQLTGSTWGLSYRRLAEATVVFMPLGIAGLLALILGGQDYLPWAHAPLNGGKQVWLVRGFWDTRVLACALVAYVVSLFFLYYSLRRDFSVPEVASRFQGWLGCWLGRNIRHHDEEAARSEARMATLAPIVAVVYAVTFTLLGFDLIMALEPNWTSTLFGAWYFIGHVFVGFAWLGIVAAVVQKRLAIEGYLSSHRQRDLGTLLFAFVLLNIDFFWSQYLTIWYGNLPEETEYLILRTVDSGLPFRCLSWIALAAFFAIPFVALLFRRVKQSPVLLSTVSVVVVVGIFLARFIEIAPPILRLPHGSSLVALMAPLSIAVMVFAGFMGAGLFLYAWFLTQVPIIPLNATEDQRS